MIDIRDLPKRYQRYYTYLEPVIADPLVRGYFSLVASFLLVAFFLFFALSPTINTILALQKKITEQKKIIASLETKISNLTAAQENYRQVESLIPLLLIALPDNPSPQTVVGSVTSSAEAK
jgi:Tfp pilus assembly protein PilO